VLEQRELRALSDGDRLREPGLQKVMKEVDHDAAADALIVTVDLRVVGPEQADAAHTVRARAQQHRVENNDIKPENILIMAGNLPKIGGIGMARFTSAGSELTRTLGGTPWFQVPELLSKDMGADGLYQTTCFPEYAAIS
jgi:serine/threonine protein kinase